jgi:hypothetical protein
MSTFLCDKLTETCRIVIDAYRPRAPDLSLDDRNSSRKNSTAFFRRHVLSLDLSLTLTARGLKAIKPISVPLEKNCRGLRVAKRTKNTYLLFQDRFVPGESLDFNEIVLFGRDKFQRFLILRFSVRRLDPFSF